MTYEHFYYKGYGCDIDGTLYSTKGKRRKVFSSSTSYEVTSVRKDGETKQYRVHRFIYECITGKFFLSHPPIWNLALVELASFDISKKLICFTH